MSHRKNRKDRLEQIVDNEARSEMLSGEFKGKHSEYPEMYAGGKIPPIRFELTPEDILYRFCKQKGIDFYELSNLFEWFEKNNRIYVVSKQLNTDIGRLNKMSHDKIIKTFDNPIKNSRCLSYNFSGREICFISYYEQREQCREEIEGIHYYGKIKIKIIAQKGRGFDEDNSQGSLYHIAMYKRDHY